MGALLPGPVALPAAAVLPLAFVCGGIAKWRRLPGCGLRASVWAAIFGVVCSCWADRDHYTGGRATAQCFIFFMIWGTFRLGARCVA
jgi:hypothetical protein